LILVAKPFAAGYKKDVPYDLNAFSKINEKLGNAAHKLQIVQTVDQLRKNPSKAKELYKLYAGDLPRDEEIPEGKLFYICLA
jgi:hypothetical protein